MITNSWRYCWIGFWLLSACAPRPLYQKTTYLENSQWPTETVLDFSFQVKDTTQTYDIVLWVKSTPDYPYQNLYVTYYLEDEAQQTCDTALENFILFDPKTGQPLGSGWGKHKTHQFVLKKAHQFSHVGLYTLQLEQFMRMEKLPGLLAMGIRVVPFKQTTP
ncbi:MAG: gliding motility lipoprotein GldH [Roseivirga sp.]